MYLSLQKLRYKDADNWKAEYEKRINSNDAVKLGFDIHGNPAFYIETTDLLKQIIRMQRLDKEIHDLVIDLPEISINHFRKRCLVDEIVLSNNIEGVYSTRKEIEDILSELKTKNKRKRFQGLVTKYLLLIENNDVSLNDSKDIRNLYNELVLPEILEDNKDNRPDGEIFRKNSVSVYSPTGKELHCGVYPENKIIESMNRALLFLKDSTSEPLFRIAAFHYVFGYIHPFYDGNGRTSRFISSYLLSKCFEPSIAFRLSFTIKENLKEYYEAFKVCNDRFNLGDITPFIYMFFDITEKSLNQLKEALEKRYYQLHHYLNKIYLLPHYDKEDLHKIYGYLIQAALFSEHGISTIELITLINKSRTTLANRLNQIEPALIIKKKEGTENYYSLNLSYFDTIISAKEKKDTSGDS